MVSGHLGVGKYFPFLIPLFSMYFFVSGYLFTMNHIFDDFNVFILHKKKNVLQDPLQLNGILFETNMRREKPSWLPPQ